MSVWEDKLKAIIAPTESKWPYRVIQVKPNRKKDEEIYALSGREEDIAGNGSLFLALYDLAQRDRIDFDEWFEQWALGFPLLTANREKSNYPLFGNNQWRKLEERPRFRDWTPPELRNKLEYRTIEVWLNRNIESESTIFSGTDMQLINHCIQIEYEGGTSNAAASLSGKNSKPILKGWPAIVLTFLEPNDRVRRKVSGAPRSRVTGEKTIRCVGYSDDHNITERGLAELINSSDIRRWANKIKDEFASPVYSWEKGKECLSYSGQIARMQGLEGYAYVRTAAQGKALFTKLLKIFDFQPDPTGWHFSANEAPDLAFPENPSNFQLLGKEWEAETSRPRATVIFDNALLYLPSLRSPISLVKGDKVIYNS